MKRNELKRMADWKLKEIKLMHENGFFDSSVSNSGYVVEFGLKAAICKKIKRDYPENYLKYKKHNPDQLVNLAGLKKALKEEKKNVNFMVNWSLISRWSVNFRYKPIGTNSEETSIGYINALEAEDGGVYTWIKKVW